MRRRYRERDSWGGGAKEEPESFWVSYSDLISGLLLIFALSTVAMMAGVSQGFAKPMEITSKWHKTIKELTADPALKSIKGVSINEKTGTLVISESQLQFRFNDARLGDQGMELLRDVVPKYLNIVRSKPELEEFIEVIEIAGHTDKRDATGANPQVSRNRAASVYNFLIADPTIEKHREFLKQNAITVGFADIRFPPQNVCPEDECENARRVEITIRLKSAEVLGEIKAMLEELKLWQER
jgi:chemotaxis protein MotB